MAGREPPVRGAGERGHAPAADGRPLAVTRFPGGSNARATLLIAGAMGVRQDFYAPLARFLAEHGIHALTFDYRGMGWSRSGSLRNSDATIATWAEQDLNAMLHEARRAAPQLPLFLVGHSLGGQIAGVLPDSELISGMVTVTAGTGWYRHNDRIPLQIRLFWFAAIPLLTPVFGYFPGKRLRMVGDLPAGVAWQWRRWSLRPEYLLSEGAHYREAFGRFRAPIVGYSFEDDEILTLPAVDDMHGFYHAAPVERRHLHPADIGATRIGHFGYFTEKSRDTLWRDTLAWLLDRA
jgi:predicted alpha/beta hydrolase